MNNLTHDQELYGMSSRIKSSGLIINFVFFMPEEEDQAFITGDSKKVIALGHARNED